jgi:O-methyltransferase
MANETAPQPPNPIRPWESDPTFRALMVEIEGHTLVDPVRCFMLYQYARCASRVRGDVAEVGVYKGGTARLLARTLGGKKIHLLDTFAGMPPTDPDRDLHREGDFADTSLAAVVRYLRGGGDVAFHPGFFPRSAEGLSAKSFCLVHVDVDIYRSVLDCCDFFYPRMEPGGIMLFDDYGFLTCPGAKVAVDEFFSDKPERPCYLPTGQCVVTRL